MAKIKITDLNTNQVLSEKEKDNVFGGIVVGDPQYTNDGHPDYYTQDGNIIWGPPNHISDPITGTGKKNKHHH